MPNMWCPSGNVVMATLVVIAALLVWLNDDDAVHIDWPLERGGTVPVTQLWLSRRGHLLVAETEGGVRFLAGSSVDGDDSSKRVRHYHAIIDTTRDACPSLLPYTDALFLPVALCHHSRVIRRALVLGVGGGILPRGLLATLPSLSTLDICDVEPSMLDIASHYFELEVRSQVRFHHAVDVAAFVAAQRQRLTNGSDSDGQYDIISMDTQPIRVADVSVELLSDLYALLSPGGVMNFNVITYPSLCRHIRDALLELCGDRLRMFYSFEQTVLHDPLDIHAQPSNILHADAHSQMLKQVENLFANAPNVPRFNVFMTCMKPAISTTTSAADDEDDDDGAATELEREEAAETAAEAEHEAAAAALQRRVTQLRHHAPTLERLTSSYEIPAHIVRGGRA